MFIPQVEFLQNFILSNKTLFFVKLLQFQIGFLSKLLDLVSANTWSPATYFAFGFLPSKFNILLVMILFFVAVYFIFELQEWFQIINVCQFLVNCLEMLHEAVLGPEKVLAKLENALTFMNNVGAYEVVNLRQSRFFNLLHDAQYFSAGDVAFCSQVLNLRSRHLDNPGTLLTLDNCSIVPPVMPVKNTKLTENTSAPQYVKLVNFFIIFDFNCDHALNNEENIINWLARFKHVLVAVKDYLLALVVHSF